MASYLELETAEIKERLDKLNEEYRSYQAKGLQLNMARGKPAASQLDLSMPLLEVVSPDSSVRSESGTDCRNYGVLDGLPEARQFMAEMMEDEPERVIVCGNSSLNIMYDSLARYWMFGALGSTPWSQLPQVKWLCPVPGYDRHFGVTEAFGISMITVPLLEDGPDMDLVESLVAEDDSIKGIWCVPQYSNPSGITYSDQVVRRLAQMKCAADDFRIFWDNAYCVHHLFDEESQQDHVLDIAQACHETHNPNRYLKFASTSKVTFPGAGIAALAASEENIAEIKKHMGAQTIGHDKLNQLRHVRFLHNKEGLMEHMAKHAAIIRPKFELVERVLTEALAPEEFGTWSKPRGGYFVSFDAPCGCAKRIVELAREAGVVMTGAGATYPHKQDPNDSNIRIAPTLPPLEELESALQVFVCCVQIAALERELANRS